MLWDNSLILHDKSVVLSTVVTSRDVHNTRLLDHLFA